MSGKIWIRLDFVSSDMVYPDAGNEVGAHAHVRDASCFQEPILAFFSAFGLSHWTIYYLSFFSMLTLSNFSICPIFLLFI